MKNASGIAFKGLAGAVALAGASEAYAAVIQVTPPPNFTPTSGTTNPPSELPWDVNGDGTVDFGMFFSQASVGGVFTSGIYGYGGVGVAATVGAMGPYVAYVSRLSLGAIVGPSSGFAQDPGFIAAFASRYNGALYGNFVGANGRGFVGFEFTAADGIHFGYFEIRTSDFVNAANPGGQVFFSAFYESTPNTAITIAIPEPGTLGALAFGTVALAGLVAHRRKTATA